MDGSIGLRLEQHSVSGVSGAETTGHLAASGRGPRRGRILIMDDEPMVRATMSRQLSIFGYEVVASTRGEEAVEAFRQAHEAGRPFDAVILDLVVDGGWGGERTLCELAKLDPGVKAMLCSGSLAGRSTDYLELGFRAVLGKPYSMGALRSLVEGVLPGV